MQANYYQKQFKNIVEHSPRKYKQEFQQILWPSLLNSSVRYHGRPVNFVYTPYFVTLAQWKFYRKFIDLFVNILNKIIREFLVNPSFRAKFSFDEKMNKYILINPGYEGHFPVARFDILFEGGKIKFCELNTDGTSAMNEVRVMQKILGHSDAAVSLRRNENISFYGFELFNSWINIILDKYREFSGKKRVNPTIAIVDFKAEGVISEFKEFKNHMESWGLECYVVDPVDLCYNGNELKYNDKVIDLIYRRATTASLFDNFKEVKDLFKAYKEKDVCICGGFRSQIIHNKAIFHILYRTEELDFLTYKEKKFLKKYILPTGILVDNPGLKKELKADQKDYILKPCDMFAGKGIKLGKNCNEDEWEQNLNKCCENNYIYQRFCEPDTIDLFTIYEEKNKKSVFEPYNFTLGFYLYDEKIKGIYNRAGRYDIIGSDYECVTVPSFVTVPKNTAVNDLSEEVKYE